MADKAEQYVTNPLYYENNILRIKVTMGAGKTRSVVERLYDIDQTFIYLTYLHKVAREVAQWPGRYPIVHVDSPKNVCLRPELLLLFGRVSNFGSVCNNLCDKADFCPRKEALRDIYKFPQSFLGVHGHLFNLLPAYLNENGIFVDTVIIDELVLPSLQREIIFDRKSITLMRVQLNNCSPNRHIRFIVSFLDSVWNATAVGRIDYQSFYDMINNYIRSLSGDISPLNKIVEEIDGAMIEAFDSGIGHNYTKNWLSEVVGLLKGLYFKRSRPYLRRLISFEREFYGVHKGFYKLIINRVALELVNQFLDGKGIIYLDGTTDLSIIRKIFYSRDIISVTKDIPIKSPVLQLSQGRYPMRSIEHYNGLFLPEEPLFTNAGQNLLELTELAVAREQLEKRKVLICCRKRYANSIRERLEGFDNFAITHYGGVVGSNAWSDYDSAVMFGTPFVSEKVVIRQARSLGVNRTDIRKLYGHDDMVQFVHRIRPLLKKYGRDCRIYCWSNQDLGLGENIRKLSIAKMKRVLLGKIPEAISLETEMRVIEKANEILRTRSIDKSGLIVEIGGNRNVTRAIINGMIERGEIMWIKKRPTRRGSAGRRKKVLVMT
jgi:hypothetical protein